jgi:hypothetical protein
VGTTVASAPVGAEPVHAADRGGVAPASLEEWRSVVDGLYRRRAEAFTTASPELLDGVHADGSALLAADTEFVAALSAAGEVLRGFAPTVERVTAAEVDGDRVRLDLVDSWPSYEVVSAVRPDGAAVRAGPGHAAAGVRMVLVRAGDSWLIESAERPT